MKLKGTDILPEILYKKWLKQSESNESDPSNGTFPAAVTILNKQGNLKKHPNLKNYIEKNKEGLSMGKLADRIFSVMGTIYDKNIKESHFIFSSYENYISELNEQLSIDNKSSWNDRKRKNTPDIQSDKKINAPNAGNSDGFKAIRKATSDKKIDTNRHASSGYANTDYPELTDLQKKYLEVFLMIQTWGGNSGSRPITKDTDKYSKNNTNTPIDRGINLAHKWIDNYIKGVDFTKKGKFKEALSEFDKVPSVDISFASKHLAIWGKFFNNIGLSDKSPTIYDTRISKMLKGKKASISDYDDISKLYLDILEEIPNAKGLTPNEVEKSLFAFSNAFFDNDLEVWKHNPEDGKSDENDVKEAKEIFCKRNPNKCEKENDSWKLLPSATSSDNKSSKPTGEDKSINGVSVDQMVAAANSLSNDNSEENIKKYKKIYDKLSSYDINDLPDTSNRKGWIKTIQDAYKETPEKVDTDNKGEEEEANQNKINKIKSFPENEEMLKAYVELAGKEPDNGIELGNFGDQYARVQDDREMIRFKNAWKNHFKEKDQKELEKLKKQDPELYDMYVQDYGEPKSADDLKQFMTESKLNKWAKWATK